jgi:hypothetical protein
MRLEDCEGNGVVDQSGGDSRGGSGHGSHDSLLLLQHGVSSCGALVGGSGGILDGAVGHGHVGRSNVGGSQSDGDSVEVEDQRGCHDRSWVRVYQALDQNWPRSGLESNSASLGSWAGAESELSWAGLLQWAWVRVELG